MSGTGELFIADINSVGQVAGQDHKTVPSSDKGFVQSPGQLAVDISYTQSGAHTQPTAINGSGTVVGNSYGNVPGAIFMWTESAGITNITSQVGVDPSSNATVNGINEVGQVLGTGKFGGPFSETEAYIWTPGTGTEHFGVNSLSLSPLSLNNNGEAVGKVSGLGSTWFYYHGGVCETLAGPTGHPFSPVAISDSGRVFGQDNSTGGMFFWTSGLGFEPIQISNSSGWGSLYAFDINSSGQIVGMGFNASNQRQYLILNPVPEPATVMGLMVGLFALRRKRSKCRKS